MSSNNHMTLTNISQQQLAKLNKALVEMLRQAPAHGSLTITIHMRDGIPHRFETDRQESLFFREEVERC